MKRLEQEKGVTLIALIVTIIILLILSEITITLTLGQDGIIQHAKTAEEENTKQTATEKINLKITSSQMHSYAKAQRMPTLQEIANDFCEDEEIEYVELTSKKMASLDKIEVGENSSIYTKLKEYPYEFEINSSLQLASVDGVKIATIEPTQTSSGINYSLEETKTNDTWMGKTIYTKTVYIPSLPNANSTRYSHNIENVEDIWIDTGKSFIVDVNNYHVVMPSVHTSSVTGSISIMTNTNVIKINTGTFDRSTFKAYVTLNYTKTTDMTN